MEVESTDERQCNRIQCEEICPNEGIEKNSEDINEKFTSNIDWWSSENSTASKNIDYVDLEDNVEMNEANGDRSSSGTEDSDASSESSIESCDEEDDKTVEITGEVIDVDKAVSSPIVQNDEPAEYLVNSPPSSLSSSSSSSEAEDVAKVAAQKLFKKKLPERPPCTPGEILPKDLPPIENLSLEVSSTTELRILGRISAIVDSFAVIETSANAPSLDMDSVLFKEDRSVLGRVFEIFGPVASPYYSIRFNSEEHALESGVQVGKEVYYAPKEGEFSRYVFVDQLRKEKGSDASWKHDNEPPPALIEYSDDETEKRERRKLRESRPSDKGESSQQSDNPQPRRKATARRSVQNRPNRPEFVQNPPHPTQSSHTPIVVGDWRHQPPPPLPGSWSRPPQAPYGPQSSTRPRHYRPPHNASPTPQMWPRPSNPQWRVPPPDATVPPPNYFPSAPLPTTQSSEAVASSQPEISSETNPEFQNMYKYYLNYYTNYYESQKSKSTNE